MTNPDPAQVDVAELRGLLEAATPGPWACNEEPEGWMPHEGRVWATGMPHDLADEVADTLDHRDAAFIAAARNALPALLDRLEAAEATEKDAARDYGAMVSVAALSLALARVREVRADRIAAGEQP